MLELGPRIAIVSCVMGFNFFSYALYFQVTCGPKGAIIAQRTSQGVTVDTVSAPKVTAVDTTVTCYVLLKGKRFTAFDSLFI